MLQLAVSSSKKYVLFPSMCYKRVQILVHLSRAFRSRDIIADVHEIQGYREYATLNFRL